MSTNSNQGDDLLEEGHNKQTKLQKFLRAIDEQTMKAIQKYLHQNQNPSHENNSKSDKIRLYTDLLIIYRFKTNESQLNDKKKIDELCQNLKQETQFSLATIRQRIQKKLSNVTKQQIMNHITLKLNFAFNTKRKLVSLRQTGSVIKSDDSKDLGLDDSGIAQKPRNPILIHSGGQQSPDSVLQVPCPSSKYKPGKKKNAFKQQLPKSKNENKIKKSKYNQSIQTYNQFRESSDHESDQQYLLIKKGKFKFTTRKVQQNLQQLAQLFFKKISQPNFYLSPKKQSEEDAIYQQDDISEQKLEHARQNTVNRSSHKNTLDNKGGMENLNDDNQELPDEQQLRYYCSLQDWRLGHSNKQYQHLKWHADEDVFLREIMEEPNSTKALKSLQVLNKFKSVQNVLNRMRFLQLNPPKTITQNIKTSQQS